jgi:cytidylate kinase
MIITIDGPAGSGKSSTAKIVAMKLGFTHLDTGAMYRALTLFALRKNISKDDLLALEKLADSLQMEFVGELPSVSFLVNNEDVTTDIRSDEVSKRVADYCTSTQVRSALVEKQKEIANKSNTVCEGRDMGRAVVPNAELNTFMNASVETRAIRRQKDFEKMGIKKSIEELVEDIKNRDEKDSNRENSPLVIPDDALILDTTDLTFDEQVKFIVDKARNILNK